MSPTAAAQFLNIAGIICFLFALIVAGGAYPPLDAGAILIHDIVDWPLNGETGPYNQDAKLLSAICGGVFAGFSMMFITIIAPGVARGDEHIRKGAIVSVLVWYAIDSGASIAAGVASNALSNTVFLAVFLTPLLLVRRAEN